VDCGVCTLVDIVFLCRSERVKVSLKLPARSGYGSEEGGAPNLYAVSPPYLDLTNASIFHRSSAFLMIEPNGGIGPTTFS